MRRVLLLLTLSFNFAYTQTTLHISDTLNIGDSVTVCYGNDSTHYALKANDTFGEWYGSANLYDHDPQQLTQLNGIYSVAYSPYDGKTIGPASVYYVINGVITDSITIQLKLFSTYGNSNVVLWDGLSANKRLRPYLLCNNETVTLSANLPPGAKYIWSTGEKNKDIIINSTGYYWITSQTNCIADTFYVRENQTSIREQTQTLCKGDSLKMDALLFGDCVWNTGAITKSITAYNLQSDTTFFAEYVDNPYYCVAADSFHIEVYYCDSIADTLSLSVSIDSVVLSCNDTNQVIVRLKNTSSITAHLCSFHLTFNERADYYQPCDPTDARFDFSGDYTNQAVLFDSLQANEEINFCYRFVPKSKNFCFQTSFAGYTLITGGISKSDWDYLCDSLPCDNSNSIHTIQSNTLQIFPNPSNGLVHLTIDQSQGNSPILIFDAMGKLVASISSQELNGQGTATINLNHLNKGIYFVKVEGSSHVERLILQ